MSLNWNVSRVENYKLVCYEQLTAAQAEAKGTTIEELLGDRPFMGGGWYVPGESDTERLSNSGIIERLRPLTNTLIWATMSVDLRGITGENHVQFYLRLKLLEKLQGAYMTQKGEDGKWTSRLITFEEVKQHIGLSTNVSPVPWGTWSRKVVDFFRKEKARSEGLEDDRIFHHAPVSQVAQDAEEMMSSVAKALKDAEIYGSSPPERRAERQQEKDLVWAYRTQDRLGVMATAWEELEDELRECEEEE